MIATSRHAHLRRFGAWTTIVLALLVMALAGCGGDNGVGPKPPGPPQYLTSSTPQNVLTNLKLAYERRDSTAYDSLFDVSYVGTSFDPSNLNTITFSKADEKRHVQALERTTSITSVSLTFSPVLIRGVDGADPPAVDNHFPPLGRRRLRHRRTRHLAADEGEAGDRAGGAAQ